MKRSIKLIIFTLILALVMIPVTASAEEYSEGAALTDVTKEGSTESGNTPSDTLANDVETETSPFAVIYSFALEHIGEIFSVLSFIGAAIIALLYKKGLLPTLRTALGSMADIISGIKDTAEKSESASSEIKEQITKRLNQAEGGINTICTSLDSLTARLEALAADDEKRKMREIMGAQIDMLYEIFLSSSLPEYQKEAVRERMQAMKEVLKNEETPTIAD